MPIEVLASVTDESCFGGGDGQVVISATGGTGDFAFSNDGVNYSQNNEFVGLGAGNFDFFVTDDNGCQEDIAASVSAPDAIVVSAIVSQGSLDGEGTIDVTVDGDTIQLLPWIGPTVFGQTTQDLQGCLDRGVSGDCHRRHRLSE